MFNRYILQALGYMYFCLIRYPQFGFTYLCAMSRLHGDASTMKAARIRPTCPTGTHYSFPGHVAPSSAIEVHDNVPVPQISKPGELLIQVKASTVFRDNLEWNELYPLSMLSWEMTLPAWLSQFTKARNTSASVTTYTV